MSENNRRVGEGLIDGRINYGVNRLFCVPGESYLAVIDALRDANSIRTIVCRQEGGAAVMAEA